MKKLVVKVDIYDEKSRTKALSVVSYHKGILKIAIDPEEQTMTVVGEFDPVKIVGKLRKRWRTDILSVGPAEENGGQISSQINELGDFVRAVQENVSGCVVL